MGSTVPDLLESFFDTSSVWLSRDYILLYACAIFLPFCFLKHIANLAFLSFVTVACLLVLTGLVLAKAIIVRPALTIANKSFFGPSALELFSAFGGLSFMFVCHDISFQVCLR